jgi:hypothetical protein
MRHLQKGFIMTNREFFIAVSENESVANDLRDFAKAQIAKLDARNEKRANTPTKTQKANEPLKANIVAYLGTVDYALASDLVEECGLKSTQQASALCRQLVDNGKLTAEEIKVKGRGTLKAYKLA